jgi:hypothetical protein
VSDQVSHPYKTGKIMILYILIFMLLDSKTNTTQNQPHQNSSTQRNENKTTDVVIQQHSRELLMMDILMSETCWAHKKWNKIPSDIKLVFHSSTFTELRFAFSASQLDGFMVALVTGIKYKSMKRI